MNKHVKMKSVDRKAIRYWEKGLKSELKYDFEDFVLVVLILLQWSWFLRKETLGSTLRST
jgi:hypothetical protein